MHKDNFTFYHTHIHKSTPIHNTSLSDISLYKTRQDEITMQRWEDNIKMDLTKIEQKEVDWIYLIQNTVHGQSSGGLLQTQQEILMK